MEYIGATSPTDPFTNDPSTSNGTSFRRAYTLPETNSLAKSRIREDPSDSLTPQKIPQEAAFFPIWDK